MKRMMCVIGMLLVFGHSWSQINEKDTIVTTITSGNSAVRLQAEVFPDFIDLQWTKGPDEQSGYFELYRSADGIAYNIVKQFLPAVFKGNDRYFTYRDGDPLRGKNYYRLIGYDRTTQEKKVVDLVAEYKNQPRKVLPTVISKGSQLNIANYDGEEMNLFVYNSAGTALFSTVVSSSIINLPGNLSGGLYVYQLIDKKKMLVNSGKFILQ